MYGKKMFKVITPIQKHNGEKYWHRCGTGFTNKDESINIYLDVIPLGKEITLQLREMTEEDLAPKGERTQHGSTESHQRAAFNLPSNPTPSPADVPF